MPKAELPTSIRLSRDLKARLRAMAERESRTLSTQITHILKTATEFVRVPRRRPPSAGKPADSAEG